MVPGGSTALPGELESKLTESSPLFEFREEFHRQEHAVEVELPLIQQVWPKAQVLPIEVPLIDDAIEIGVRTARQIAAANFKPVFLASSDLTHYGPNYGFAPAGVGIGGIQWAMENDRRVLDLVSAYQAERIVDEVRNRLNACGGGAIAAMMAASREFGASEGRVIWQTNSYQTLADVAPQPPTNAVGYAAVVVG
jgi:AmmeMemoRadiSam system protein B